MDKNVYLKILKLFEIKGTHFTTEELAKELGSSKRTIYSCFGSKDEMIEKTIDFVFLDIMQSDRDVMENTELSITEKIERSMLTIPDIYNLGAIIQHADDLERYYPALWKKVNTYLDQSWDNLIYLVTLGIEEGELEEIDVSILRMMLNESLKKLLDYRFIVSNNCSFESGITAISQIVLKGILKR
jgi:AcrR family transcriptional regulator